MKISVRSIAAVSLVAIARMALSEPPHLPAMRVRPEAAAAPGERVGLIETIRAPSRCAFSADGKRLFASGAGAVPPKVFAFDTNTREEIFRASVGGESHDLDALIPSPDGKSLMALAGNGDRGRIFLLDAATGKQLPVGVPKEAQRSVVPAFTPGGSAVGVMQGTDGRRSAVNLTSGRMSAPKHRDSEPVASDGRTLVSLVGGSMEIGGFPGGSPIRTYVPHGGPWSRVAFSRDGRWVAISGVEGKLVVIERGTGEILFEKTVDRRANQIGNIGSLAFSPDGRFIAWHAYPGAPLLIGVPDGTRSRIASPADGYTSCIAFHPDGRHIARGTHEGLEILDLSRALTPSGAARSVLLAKDRLRQWAALKGSALEAYRASEALATDPRGSVTLIREELGARSAHAPPSADYIAALVEQLGGGAYRDRHVGRTTLRRLAAREIEARGEGPVIAALSAAATSPDPELREGARQLIESARQEAAPWRRQQLRAVSLLAGIATPEAIAFLTELARGEGPLAEAAADALARRR